MTGSHTTHAPSPEHPMHVDNAIASPTQIGPYAKPTSDAPPLTAIDAVLIDAIRASAGPYVPATLRSRPDSAQAVASPRTLRVPPVVIDTPSVSGDLPWIDAFVDDTPSSESPSDSDTILSDGDPWPLGDASSTIRSLVNGLGPSEVARPSVVPPTKVPSSESTWESQSPGSASAPETSEAMPSAPADTVGQNVDLEAIESALHAPLPMWRDDDLMDIMPVRQSRDEHAGTEHWAEKARRESTTENHAEAAATVLEAVASRVRNGSLVVPGFVPSMSDAAAITATLAALLSTHE